jgi:type II secretory ATPase GspE/PulE/Tfp pilus assembly ATPase PilB-like protein
MPSDSAVDVLAAWAKAVGDPKAASERLRLFVAQRLVRTLCQSCRAAYVPSPAEAKMLAIPAGKQVQIYKQTGKVLIKDQPTECPTCKGSGFVGVSAAVEVLPFDDEARVLLASGDAKGAVLHARRAFKCPSVQDAALIKVRSGETSFDEVKRVFAPPAAKPATPAAGAASPAAKPATPAAAKPAAAPARAAAPKPKS